MTISIYDIAYLFSEIFTLYSIKIFYDIFFPLQKGHKYFAMGAYAAYFAGTVALHFFVNIPFINLIANIVLLFGIALCYQSTIQKKIIAVSECYLIMFVSEILISAVTKSAYIEIFQKYEYENILGLFLSRMVIFFVVLLIGRLTDLRKNKDLPNCLCLISLSVPILTVSIEIIFITTSGATTRLVVISMVLLFAVNIMVFFLFNLLSTFYERSLISVTLEQERLYYQNQCILMQKATEDIRSFQHDISNHFMIIEDLLRREKEKEAFTYIIELVKSEKTVPITYSDTGNIAVDSIINYKLCNAVLLDIAVTVDIIIPKELPVEIIDLSTILTNLLDNAIQALEKLKENKKLDIKMVYKKGTLLIRIHNTYNGVIKYENGEIISTKEDSSEHGYGMRNIAKAVEKYDGVCQITHENNIFQSEVLLYLVEIS
ncbi:MAG: GHKL domain-containing protein [Ruminococcus flavefaciens]|nr:GHKL domain-containing protein [Ruminococcus flavefaciens]